MTLKTKNTILSLLVGAVILISYVIFILNGKVPAEDDIMGWAQNMVIFIGAGFVLVIVLQILFYVITSVGMSAKHGGKDRSINKILVSELVESNEMDKLISLKASHVGYGICGVGIVAGLVALSFGVSAVLSLHIFAGSLFLAGTIEGIMSIIYYEKGIK